MTILKSDRIELNFRRIIIMLYFIDESLRYTAALTSIKMENPGPFNGTIADVLDRMSST